MADFYISQGNLLPTIQTTLKTPAGASIDLTGCTVNLTMRIWQNSKTFYLNKPCDIIGSPTLGVVRYTWASPDTNAIGNYYCRWVISYPDGRVQSVPNPGYDIISIGRK